MAEIYYIVRRAEPEILGSGSVYSMEVITKSELEAFQLLSECGRNELIRVYRFNGKTSRCYWDSLSQAWVG